MYHETTAKRVYVTMQQQHERCTQVTTSYIASRFKRVRIISDFFSDMPNSPAQKHNFDTQQSVTDIAFEWYPRLWKPCSDWKVCKLAIWLQSQCVMHNLFGPMASPGGEYVTGLLPYSNETLDLRKNCKIMTISQHFYMSSEWLNLARTCTHMHAHSTQQVANKCTHALVIVLQWVVWWRHNF